MLSRETIKNLFPTADITRTEYSTTKELTHLALHFPSNTNLQIIWRVPQDILQEVPKDTTVEITIHFRTFVFNFNLVQGMIHRWMSSPLSLALHKFSTFKSLMEQIMKGVKYVVDVNDNWWS